MHDRDTTSSSFSRLLRYLGWSIATLLLLLVFFSPLVDNTGEQLEGTGRLIALLARDATVRRTLIASAIGLAVTASVFFRSTNAAPKAAGRPTRQAPSKVVGA
jgi:hypothetical protein